MPPESVQPGDVVELSRLEPIPKRRVRAGVAAHVLVLELENIHDLLVKLLDKADTADELHMYFDGTRVIVSSFESTLRLARWS